MYNNLSGIDLAKTIFLREITGISYVDIAIVCILSLVVLIPGCIRIKKKKSTGRDVLLSYLLCVCIGIMLLITFFRRETGYQRYELNPFPSWEDYGGNEVKTLLTLFNIILFAPFGFILRIRSHRIQEIKAFIGTILWGLLFTSTIEIAQYIANKGFFEFTDMLNNLIGTVVGAAVGTMLLRRLQKNMSCSQDKNDVNY